MLHRKTSAALKLKCILLTIIQTALYKCFIAMHNAAFSDCGFQRAELFPCKGPGQFVRAHLLRPSSSD